MAGGARTLLAELVAGAAGRPRKLLGFAAQSGTCCPKPSPKFARRAAICCSPITRRPGAGLRRGQPRNQGWLFGRPGEQCTAVAPASKLAWPIAATALGRPARTCCSAWKRRRRQSAPSTGWLRALQGASSNDFQSVGRSGRTPA